MPKTSQTDFKPENIDPPLHLPHRAYHKESGWEPIAALGPILSLSTGYIIYTAANPVYCYLVLSGMMGAFVEEPDEALSQSSFFLRGSMFLEPTVLSQLPAPLVYRAIEPTKLVRINRVDLKRAMMRHEGVFDFVMSAVAEKLNAAQEQVREAKTLDVRERVYLMLLGLAKDCGKQGSNGWIVIDLKLTQQSMSDMLSVNRVTVNTALQDLYDAQVVRKSNGRYAVRDPQGIISSAL